MDSDYLEMMRLATGQLKETIAASRATLSRSYELLGRTAAIAAPLITTTPALKPYRPRHDHC
jgi:hypothetical protein